MLSSRILQLSATWRLLRLNHIFSCAVGFVYAHTLQNQLTSKYHPQPAQDLVKWLVFYLAYARKACDRTDARATPACSSTAGHATDTRRLPWHADTLTTCHNGMQSYAVHHCYRCCWCTRLTRVCVCVCACVCVCVCVCVRVPKVHCHVSR